MGAFFGRAGELAALHGAVGHSLGSETAAVIVVEGDAGSGKTRTLRELLAGIGGVTKVSVACYEPERRLPFALGRTLTSSMSKTSADAHGPLHDDAAAIVGARGWERRYEAVHGVVSAAEPIVLAVDDVQWCDEESAALLHYIVRGANHDGNAVSLVLAGRPSPPVTALASSLHRLVGEQYLELRLGPLDRSAAIELVQSVDPTMELDQARQVAQRADGSPFWCEILATAVDHRERIQEVVARRLHGRSPDAAAALELIVALGRPVEAVAIADIRRWPEGRAATATDELSNAGLVTHAAAQVRISHDLLRTELAAQVSISSRAHTLIAKWLEDTAGDDVSLLLEAADHLRRAGVSPGRVLQRALASPRRRLVGPEGLPALVAAVDDVFPEDPAAVPLNQAVARLAAELGAHALAAERWVRVATRLSDDAERARAWLAGSEAAQHLEQPQEARHYLDLARQAAPDDPVLAVELDAAEAHVLRWLENDGSASARVTAAALDRARRLAQAEPGRRNPALPRGYIKALEMACVDAMQRDAADEILRLAEELGAVAAGADVRASVRARLRGGSALMLVGRLRAATEVLAGAWSDARHAFLNDLVLDVGSWLAWTYHLRGRLVEAEEVASECTAVAAKTGAATRPALMARQWRSIVAISRGEAQGAVDQLRALAAGETDTHHRIWIRRCVATWLARLEGVRAADPIEAQLRAGAEDVEAAGCARCGTEFLLAGAEAFARIGLPDQAEDWLKSDAAGTRNDLEEWWTARATASIAIARGGDVTEAFQPAIAFAEMLDLRLELVWALLDFGRALVPSDRDTGIATLRRAAEEAEMAGAVTEERIATRLLRELGVHVWAGAVAEADAWSRLSPREREIAALVSQGASNLDIAGALYLSRKTIERHVSNIFAKLDVRNRAQLAARVSARPSRDDAD